MATKQSNLVGGSFLLKDAQLDDIFIPEQFSEEQNGIKDMVIDFCKQEIHSMGFEKLSALSADKDLDKVKEIFDKASELGFCAGSIPEVYGGMGLDFNTGLVFSEAIALGFSFATTIGAQTSIGSLPIVWYGSEAQKQQYLPKIASGEYACSYCLTEPTAGSDANSGKTNAVLNAEGTHYLINGQKMWITNGGFADVFIVFAKIENDERLSAFIVEKEFGGIEIGKEEKKMGIKASSTVQLFFNNCPVPKENLLGERGKGFNMALNILNSGRIKIAAGATGGIKFGTKTSVEYAAQRIQFGKPISDFGAMKQKIGNMVMQGFVLESAVYRTGADVDKKYDELKAQGKSENDSKIDAMREYAIECAILKCQGSEAMCNAADEAIQIFGGMGYSMETGVEMAYRDARITKIYEGTNEINRMLSLAEFYKRAFQTKEIKLKDASTKIPLGLAQNLNPFSNGKFDKEEEIVNNLKNLFLIITGAAGRKLKTKLVDEQEIVMNLADILAMSYMTESALLRVKKLASMKDIDAKELEMKTKAMQLYIYEALDVARKSAANAIDSYASGVEKFAMRRLVDGLLRAYEINPKDMRRALADYAVEKMDYPF